VPGAAAPTCKDGTIRDTAPSRPVDGSAMIAAPPHEREAPSTKSNWPPMPAT
jgi:hypothetical protein